MKKNIFIVTLSLCALNISSLNAAEKATTILDALRAEHASRYQTNSNPKAQIKQAKIGIEELNARIDEIAQDLPPSDVFTTDARKQQYAWVIAKLSGLNPQTPHLEVKEGLKKLRKEEVHHLATLEECALPQPTKATPPVSKKAATKSPAVATASKEESFRLTSPAPIRRFVKEMGLTSKDFDTYYAEHTCRIAAGVCPGCSIYVDEKDKTIHTAHTSNKRVPAGSFKVEDFEGNSLAKDPALWIAATQVSPTLGIGPKRVALQAGAAFLNVKVARPDVDSEALACNLGKLFVCDWTCNSKPAQGPTS